MKQEYLIKHKRRKIRGVKKQIGKLEINNETSNKILNWLEIRNHSPI